MPHSTILTTLILATALSLSQASPAPAQQARTLCTVLSVFDGDTIKCKDNTRVRLLLIDSPELAQKPFGPQAGTRLRAIALGKTVWLEKDIQTLDQHGRTLAYVWTRPTGGIMLNELMVTEGLALVLSYPPNIRHIDRIRSAANIARNRRAGLWQANGFACSPKDHRKNLC